MRDFRAHAGRKDDGIAIECDALNSKKRAQYCRRRQLQSGSEGDDLALARRLTTDECARAIRQSGPTARLPLLTEWKLLPMKYPPRN